MQQAPPPKPTDVTPDVTPDATTAGRADPPARGGPLLLTDRRSIRAAVIELAAAAQRELLIFSHDLDPQFYDNKAFISAVQRLALARPWHPVRILVGEPRQPVITGHRLIGLSRRLSSRVAVRRVAEDFRDRPDAFLIADTGYCVRRLADRPEALVEFQAPAAARRLRAEFEQIWEQSDEDTELRRLDL